MRTALSRPLAALSVFTLVACVRSGVGTTVDPSDTTPAAPRARITGAAFGLMDPPITSFGALRVGERVYVVGGYSGTPHAYDSAGQHDALRALSLTSGAVEIVSHMPYRVQSPTLVAHDGSLFVHGGMRARNAPGEPQDLVSERRIVRFDAARRAEVVGELPEGRSSHAAVVLGASIYVIGGWTLEGAAAGRFATETFVLDAEDGHTLRRRLPQPFALRALAAVTVGDRIVIVGGMTDRNATSSDTYLLDANGTFTEGPDFPTNAFGVAAVAHQGHAYASAADGRVYRLAADASRWEEVGSLAFPRFFHQLVSSDDGLLAIGGIAGMSPDARVSVVERVRLDGEAGEPLVVELPGFGEARNRQGMAVVGGDLLLFGGNDSMAQHDFAPSNFERAAFRVHLGSLDVSPMPDLPVSGQSFTTVLTDEDVAIAIGGFGPAEGGVTSRRELYVLDGDDRFVPAGFTLPNPRTQIAAHFVDGTIWVLGGLDYDDRRADADQFRHFDDVLACPFPRGPCAPAGVSLPGTRRAFASAEHDGRIYVVGGMREQFAPVTDCGFIDTRDRSWHEIACPNTTRFSASLVAVGDALVLVGGTVAGAADDDAGRVIERYDPATNTWQTLGTRVPFSTVHLRGFAFSGRLLLASTHAEDRALRLAFIDVRGH